MSFRAGRTGGEYATETVIEALGKRGAQLPPLKSLDALVRVTAEIGRGTQPQRRRLRMHRNYYELQSSRSHSTPLGHHHPQRPDKRNAVSYELIDDLIRARRSEQVFRSHFDLTARGRLFARPGS